MLDVLTTKIEQIMETKTAHRLLEILSVPREKALTAMEVCKRYYKREPTGNERRKIQRDLKNLLEGKVEAALVKKGEPEGREFTYFLERSAVARWLMTEEAALNILLTRQLLGQSFFSVDQIKAQEVGELAEKVSEASDMTTRIRERVRIVQDWIGREPARKTPDGARKSYQEVVKEVFNAVAQGRQVRFTYVHRDGTRIENKTVSPQGLVAKDGSIYLLGTEGFNDIPSRGLPLHRMEDAECTSRAAQDRSDFDLDGYIRKTGQLSHAFDPSAAPIALKLRVAPETIYHFQERPLSPNQHIKNPNADEPWFVVTDFVPSTILLVPFLLSMGGWIEVLEPPEVREEMAERVHKMAAHYPPPK